MSLFPKKKVEYPFKTMQIPPQNAFKSADVHRPNVCFQSKTSSSKRFL